MKKLGILVMAMVMVFGLSLGALAQLDTDTVGINATVTGWAQIDIASDVLNYNFSNPEEATTESTNFDLFNNQPVTVAATVTQELGSDFNITTVLSESSFSMTGTHTEQLYVGVEYLINGPAGVSQDAGTYNGEVTLTVTAQ